MTKERKSSTEQFGAVASRYVESAIHAKGLSLGRVIELVQPQGDDIALDIATGAGHMALAMAPLVHTVFATDITPQMLHEARKLAASRGLTNVKFEIAEAGNLPYPDEAFDIVTCRIAAHHFPDVTAFVKEAARVLKPGGRIAVVDDTVTEDQEEAAFLNEIEWLRDRSHIRNYAPSEWQRFFEQAGLEIEALELVQDLPEGMSYSQWMYRANAQDELVEEVRQKLVSAPEKFRKAYGIEEQGDDLVLYLPVVIIVGKRRMST